ncbi:MAG: ATP-binding protein, partial [Gemmatimonadota bacterium]
FPARFILVGAMNPCPCGYAGDPVRGCRCSPESIERYLSRISGPLLDRIDIQLAVPTVAYRDLSTGPPEETSAMVRQRVDVARARQQRRFAAHPGLFANAQIPVRELRHFCALDAVGDGLLTAASTRLGLSARACHRVVKIGRTIADIEGAEQIAPAHIREAIQYRALDRGRLGARVSA